MIRDTRSYTRCVRSSDLTLPQTVINSDTQKINIVRGSVRFENLTQQRLIRIALPARSRQAHYANKMVSKRFYKRRRENRQKKRVDRLGLLMLAFFLLGGLITIRLFNLQVLQHSFYIALAEGQHDIYQKLFPERGEILVMDRYASDNSYKVATNRDFELVYAVPKHIENPQDAADKLAPILGVAKDELLGRLSKENDLYEPLKHKVMDEEMSEIDQLDIKGIESTTESFRFYPEEQYFSHVVGFVGFVEDERKGRYGLESYFEEMLAGEQGELQAERDAAGRWITIGDKYLQEATDGDDLVLTLDHNLQYYGCGKLAEAVQKHGADSGTLIIMDPRTGSILAMCNAPDFDPNNYSATEDISTFNNLAVYDQYEPGSVFKPITMASALDLERVSPTTTYVDKGYVQIGSYTIQNSDGKAYGTQDMNAILEESLNTGAIFVVRQVGGENFYEYVQNFGFGELTGIALPTESVGNISSLATYKDIYSATASYGQGITVTPLQLVNAYATIANGGTLMQPYIVKEIVKPNGYRITTEPKEVRQVISNKTATTLSAMLVNVINRGHAQRAGVPGYFLAGKTGTAQIPRQDSPGYESGEHHKDTFVGFGPISDPKFVMLVKMDRPKGISWAAGSVAPIFGDVAKFLLDYYQVPPDDIIEEE